MATLALQVFVDDPADHEMSSLHRGVMQMTDAAIISHPVIISYGFCNGRKRFVQSVSQFCPMTNETITCGTKAWNRSTAQTRLALYSSPHKRDLCYLTQSCNDTTVIVLFISYFLYHFILVRSNFFIDISTAYKFYFLHVRWMFWIGLLLQCSCHLNPTGSAERNYFEICCELSQQVVL